MNTLDSEIPDAYLRAADYSHTTSNVQRNIDGASRYIVSCSCGWYTLTEKNESPTQVLQRHVREKAAEMYSTLEGVPHVT